MRAWPANVVFYGSAHSKPCFQYLRWVIKDTRSPAVSSANATRGESFSPKDLSLEVAIFFLIRSLVCSFLVQPTYSQLSKFKTIVLGRAKHLRVPALLQMSAVCFFFFRWVFNEIKSTCFPRRHVQGNSSRHWEQTKCPSHTSSSVNGRPENPKGPALQLERIRCVRTEKQGEVSRSLCWVTKTTGRMKPCHLHIIIPPQ